MQLTRYRANQMMKYRPVANAAMGLFNRAYQNRNVWKSKSRTRPMNKKRVSDGRGITGQFDKTLIYKKKKMPYRKKKSWISFSRKVRAVFEKELGTKTVLFNTQIQGTNGIGLQGILTIGLYGCDGLADAAVSNYCGLKDLNQIMSNDPMDVTGKAKFKSAVLDVTFSAASNNTAATEVDVYELWFNGKDCPFTSVNAIFGAAEANTGTISGAGTEIRIVDRGATPFDLPNAFSIGHFSVAKKMKYFLPPAGTFTYQIRDPRTFVFNKADVLDTDSIAPSKKCFRVLYVIYKPVTGTILENTLFAGVTRKYSYSVLEQTADKDNILT